MASVILIAYLLAVIGIGVYMRRRVRDEKDYLAAGARSGRSWAGRRSRPRR